MPATPLDSAELVAGSLHGRVKGRAGHRHSRALRAFTMIEIAIALGIIAFALVAVIGILPSGLTLQKQTRERSIIDKEANYWIETLSHGGDYIDAFTNRLATGDDLVRFVDSINGTPGPFFSKADIVGLLSRTNLVLDRVNDLVYEYEPMTAIVRPINSTAIERGSIHQDFAFKYQMNVHLAPSRTIRPDHPEYFALQDRLWEMKLEFAWPVVSGRAINTQAVYRASISGTLTNLFLGPDIYTFFKP